MIRKAGISFLALFFILLTSLSPGQMPGWKFFTDGDGNNYFLDRNGKIYITTPLEKVLQPVTVRGLEFYIAAVNDLIKAHRTVDALRIIKTILAMDPSDNRIIQAQAKVLRIKHELIKRNGSRYNLYNQKASPLVYSNKPGLVTIMNENMHYSLGLKGNAAVIKTTIRNRPLYRYHGILLGISFENSKGAALFDCLMAVDAEKFALTIKDIEKLEESWGRRMVPYPGKIKKVLSGANASLYRLTGGKGAAYSGYEGYIINGVYGYAFRIITPAGEMKRLDEKLKALAFSIKLSTSRKN